MCLKELSYNATDWLIKYILPIIIVPIISSFIVCYGTISSIKTQLENNSHKLDKLEIKTDSQDADIKLLCSRMSKTEAIVDNYDDLLRRTLKINDRQLEEIKKIGHEVSDVKKSVAVLEDRSKRR